MTRTARRAQWEAIALLAVARIAIRTLPFRWLAWWSERPLSAPELHGNERRIARRDVRRAVWQASRRLPGRSRCFSQAVAAQTMLRRRGVGSELYCGAASTTARRRLQAHVWLKDGRAPIIGVRASNGYATLARYPDTGHHHIKE